nr:hypothetical protein [Tanacetum cinerariifolium]
MVVILEKGEFNTDFHQMVDFIAASPLRIETTDEGTHILATVDGIQRTVSEASLRRNLKLRDEDGIVSIPDTELFENLTLMGIVPLFDTILIHHGEGSGTPTEPHHTPFPEWFHSHCWSPATIISTSSKVGPTASPIVPRRKGKEVMVESDTPKKKKLQEQIDAQVARELKEQQEREDMMMNEQIARDAEVARIHAEEEIQ